MTSWSCLKAALPVCALAMALAVVSAAAATEPAPLRIGVGYVPPKADVPAARLYTQEGFDLDFAAEIGRRLGRKVTLVDIGHEGAVEAVTSGRVDALIARSAEGDGGFTGLEVVPTGYVSGLSVAMRTDTNISSWEQLADRTVCVAAGNQEAQLLARRLGAKLVVQPAPALSLMRVRTGECDAALHDGATLNSLFGDPEWKKFSATLPARDESRLVVVLAKVDGPQNEALHAAVPGGTEPRFWPERLREWARNVALEVYLDQDAPDCH